MRLSFVSFTFILVVNLFSTSSFSKNGKCKETIKLDPYKLKDWKGQEVLAWHSLAASKECPGPKLPYFILLHTRANAWIHIVDTSLLDAKLKQYIEIPLLEREKGAPFFSRGPKWEHNPNIAAPKNAESILGDEFTWVAQVFPVRIQGKMVIPLGCYSWGFSWAIGASQPKPYAVESCGKASWIENLPKLQKEFPDWTYGDVGG